MGDSHDDGWADATHFSRREKRVAPKERPGGNPFGWVSPWTPFLNDQKEGAAAPSFGIHPRERQREEKQDALTSTLGICANVTTCGISVGGEARCSAPGWSWANLRKAGYQPSHPQTCPDGQVWTKRLFLPPCTAHSFSPRRKRMGVQCLRPSTHSSHGNQANFPQNLFTFRILFAKLYPAYKKPLL